MTMRQSTRRKTERVQGVTLPTVMVMLFLCSVLALAAWRDIWLSEQRLQARADIIRSQWLANTLLHGALDDVLQRNAVTSNTSNHAGSLRHDMGAAEQNHVFFRRMQNNSKSCDKGLAPVFVTMASAPRINLCHRHPMVQNPCPL